MHFITVNISFLKNISVSSRTFIRLELKFSVSSKTLISFGGNFFNNSFKPIELIHLDLLHVNSKVLLNFSVSSLIDHNREFQIPKICRHDIFLSFNLILQHSIQIRDVSEEFLDCLVNCLISGLN
jgi:hypothetical protein